MAKKTDWFVGARFGMFIHWGLYAVPARGEWVWSWEKMTGEQYGRYFEEWDPSRYEPREWARVARGAGIQYAVITAKHHDGFCLFDSALTDWKASVTRGRAKGRDLLREWVEAFRGAGLKVGFYYSLLDWHHPEYTIDIHHPMKDVLNAAAGAAGSPPTDGAQDGRGRELGKYLEYLHGQVRELMTGYGKIDLLWFDFSFGEKRGEAWRAKELVKMVRELQPGILMNNRLLGAQETVVSEGETLGEINTPEQMIPAEGVVDKEGKPVVWEACITLNDHWGYARDDRNFKTAAEVVRMLVETVSKGGNLLLNVGPNAKGEIQKEASSVLAQVGEWMRVNGESVIGCGRAEGLRKPEWGRYTQRGGRVYAHVFERPMGPIVFEGLGGGRVKKARFLADGSELVIDKPWNAPEGSGDLFVTLPRTGLLDELDTVIELEVGDRQVVKS